MVSRKERRQRKKEREKTIKRFRRERLLNKVTARPGIFEYTLVLDHLRPRFNIGKILRSADAFGCRAVHLVGTGFFDPAPAKGSFRWVPAEFHDDFDDCYGVLAEQGYTCFVFEPDIGTSLGEVSFPRRSAFIFGNEEFGPRFDKDRYPDIRPLKIGQYGTVESLNVSIAASIVMYEYVRQHGNGVTVPVEKDQISASVGET
jgi:tRNA G18 (ribose-2'-O)-methylase SpoU